MDVLVNAASAHMGGAYTYIHNLVRWVPRIAPEASVTVCVPRDTERRLRAQSDSNVSLHPYPGTATGGVRRIWFDQIQLSLLTRRWDVDLLFSTTGFGTFISSCPEVLLVQNPIYFDTEFARVYRELGRSLIRVRLRRWYSRISIRAADVVVFPSRSMKEMVEDHISLEDEWAFPLHFGFDRESFLEESERTEPSMRSRRDAIADADFVLLNVSTYAVHKNFEVLIEALARLPDEVRDGLLLVTTTSREQTSDTNEYDALQRKAADLGVQDHWLELGYVEYSHLSEIYGLADVFVFPSFTESFGHPMVEAMASGLPVLAADTSINREIVGEAGLYFPPYDSGRWADGLEGVIRGESAEVERGRDRAVGRSKHFSWERHFEELFDAFRSLV